MDVGRRVATPWGRATCTLVGDWIAVSASGDLLERDVWRVELAEADLSLEIEVRTFPDPSDGVLEQVVLRELGAAVARTR